MAMKNEEGYNRYIANKNEKKRASNEKRADKNAIIEKINEKVKFLNSRYGEEMFNDIDTFEGYENGAEELIYKFERKQNYGGWVSKDMAYRSGIKIFGDEAHGNNYVNIVFVKNEDKESLPLLTDIYILLRTKDKWYKASSEGIESFVNDIYDTGIVNGIIQDFESFKLNTENFVASFNTFVNQVGDSRRVQTINHRKVKDSAVEYATINNVVAQLKADKIEGKDFELRLNDTAMNIKRTGKLSHRIKDNEQELEDYRQIIKNHYYSNKDMIMEYLDNQCLNWHILDYKDYCILCEENGIKPLPMGYQPRETAASKSYKESMLFSDSRRVKDEFIDNLWYNFGGSGRYNEDYEMYDEDYDTAEYLMNEADLLETECSVYEKGGDTVENWEQCIRGYFNLVDKTDVKDVDSVFRILEDANFHLLNWVLLLEKGTDKDVQEAIDFIFDDEDYIQRNQRYTALRNIIKEKNN